MYLVENPLRIGIKWVKVRDEKEASIRIELTKAIEAIGKILYEREHVEKEGPVYEYDEMRNLLQTKELNLKDFFDQRQNVMSRRWVVWRDWWFSYVISSHRWIIQKLTALSLT